MGRPGVFIRTPEYCKKLSEGVRKHLPKTAFKKGHIPWHNGTSRRPHCVDCGKIIEYNATRCWKCFKKFSKGENHFNWSGGKIIDKSGYILVYKPQHPFASAGNKSYVREHRLVVEKQIGRYLHKWEFVHHINKIKDDNRPKNLMAFKSNSAHRRFEKNKKVKKEEIVFDGRKMEGVLNGKPF